MDIRNKTYHISIVVQWILPDQLEVFPNYLFSITVSDGHSSVVQETES